MSDYSEAVQRLASTAFDDDGWMGHMVSLVLADQGKPQITNEMVEAGARALFDEPWIDQPREMTWAQVVTEDPSRADLWREDARHVLGAALSGSEA